MAGPELTRLLLFTENLQAVHDFYTAIGVKWVSSPNQKFGRSGLPEEVERSKFWREGGIKTGVPDMWCELGEMAFLFYLDRSQRKPSVVAGLVVRIDVDDPHEVVGHLKRVGLFKPAPNVLGAPSITACVLDPDGRELQICMRGSP
jgi:hypothetical protein